MRKIMFILILISSLWSEDIKIDDEYEVYISKTRNVDFSKGIKSSNEVFFGRYETYLEKRVEEIKNLGATVGNGAVSGLSSAATAASNSAANATGKAVGQGLGVGLGIGLVFGLGELAVTKYTEDEHFILIKDYENNAGEKTRVAAFFIANSFKEEPLIKSFLLQEIKNKYNL